MQRDPPLVATRSTGRPRTYSADSGYVYQYDFAGFRRVRRSGEAYIEYVFSVSGAREAASPISVFLAEDRLAEWSGTLRELTASERYAIAKLCLKRGLDRFHDPRSMDKQIAPDHTEVAEISAILDL